MVSPCHPQFSRANWWHAQSFFSSVACCTIRVSKSRTVSKVDTNTDFSLVNVVTVAFYCSVPMGIMGVAWHVPSCVNGQWTAALGAMEGDEPLLTTAVAVQMKVSLINNTESGVIFLLVENVISKIITESRLYELIERKRRFCDLTQLGIMSWKRITLRTRNTSLRTEKKKNLKWHPCEFNRYWFHYTIQRPRQSKNSMRNWPICSAGRKKIKYQTAFGLVAI